MLAGEDGYLLNHGAEIPLNRPKLAPLRRRDELDILGKFTSEAPTFFCSVASVPQQIIAVHEVAGVRDGFRGAREPLAYFPQASRGFVHLHAFHAMVRRIQFVI